MIISHHKITIIRHRRPSKSSLNEQLQWLGSSLGLFGLRDRDKSCFRIFVELIKATKAKKPVTSDELAFGLNLSRGTVIHHINNLIKSGLVIHEGNKYMLRVENLTTLIEEVEKDIERTCHDLKQIAKNIDKELGL